MHSSPHLEPPMTRKTFPRLLVLLLLLAPASLRAQAGSPVAAGEALVRASRFGEARRLLMPYARSHPRDGAAAQWIGRAYLGEDSTDQAVEWLEKATSLTNTAQAWMALAQAYGAQANEANLFSQPFIARKARRAMESAAAAEPRNVLPRFALLQFHAATPWLYGGSRSAAEEQAKALARMSPYFGSLGRAILQATDNDGTGAVRTLGTVARQYPDSAVPVSMLAGMYRQKHDWTNAWKVLDDFRRAHPNDRHVLFDVGVTARASAQRLDDGERAFLDYARGPVPENSPPVAAAHYELGQLYEQKGRKDLARAQYQEALRLDPQLVPARGALKALDRPAS
jgi:tetratricopeptide (TPR) repeat protein